MRYFPRLNLWQLVGGVIKTIGDKAVEFTAAFTGTSATFTGSVSAGGTFSTAAATAFADADATPSVAGHTNFKTANTGATTITDFDDGIAGQHIYVWVADAVTTFDFSSSALSGNGGVDYAASSGDLLHFWTDDGTHWYSEFLGAGDLLAANNLSDVASAATAFANIKQAATDAATGVVELATDAEAVAASSDAVVTTPGNLAAVFAAPPALGSGTPAAVSGTTGTFSGAVTGTTVAAYDTIWIGAGAMIPCTTAGAEPATQEAGTNDIDLDVLAFDAGATEERAQFSLVMPENWNRSTLKAKFYWTNASGASANDTAEFGIKAGALSNDDAIDAALGTAVTVSDTLIAAGDLHVTAATGALTVGGTPALGDLIQFEVFRNTDGTDDMAEDAWLIGVLIQYTKSNTVSAW